MTARGYHSRAAARPPVARWPFPLLLACLLLVCVLAACQDDTPQAQATRTGGSATRSVQATQTPGGDADDAAGVVRVQALPEPAERQALPDPTAAAAAPTDTVRPSERMAKAEQAYADGEYEVAIGLLGGMVGASLADKEPEVYLLLAQAYLATGQTREAIPLLEALVAGARAGSRGAAHRVLANGLLAYSYESVGSWAEAIEAFGAWIELAPHMAPYAHWRMADAFKALGESERQAEHLAAVDLGALTAAQRAEVLEDLAKAQRGMGEYELALASYDAILSFAEWPSYRALLAEFKAETLMEAGRAQEGVAALEAVLASSPTTTAGLLALRALDDLEAADIDDLVRANVYYGARLYQDALEVLEGATPTDAAADSIEPLYLRARCYAALGQYGNAFVVFDDLLDRYPQDPAIADVWLAKAMAAEDNGGDPSGIYREFWRQYPEEARAPEALWLSAQSLDGQGSWMLASEFYALLRKEYPEYERAQEAAFREGLMRYALGEPGQAAETWAEQVDNLASPDERARWLTWLGIAAQAVGDAQAAAGRWEEAIASAPDSYYGWRAADLLAGERPLLPADAGTIEEAEPLTKRDWTSIGKWVRDWAPEREDQDGVDPADDQRMAMAVTFWQLSRHSEALLQTGAMRQDVKEDPEALLSLAQASYEAGIIPAAISAAETLFSLAREAGETEVPEALRRIAYPTPYIHLVNAEALARGVDPLIFMALIRQESRFDPLAVSYAGARGLTQVMPATGEWIASRLGADAYHDDLLYRPATSVFYGLWYLQTLLDMYDRDWIAALVAYNAGPGNLGKWTGGEPIADHDLFYETIPVQQAQDYVTLVYRQYRNYQAMYRE